MLWGREPPGPTLLKYHWHSTADPSSHIRFTHPVVLNTFLDWPCYVCMLSNLTLWRRWCVIVQDGIKNAQLVELWWDLHIYHPVLVFPLSVLCSHQGWWEAPLSSHQTLPAVALHHLHYHHPSSLPNLELEDVGTIMSYFFLQMQDLVQPPSISPWATSLISVAKDIIWQLLN